jgi:TolB-like protein
VEVLTVVERRVERKLSAILAADVAGYSRLMAADEEGTLARLKTYRHSLFDPKITEHRGRIIKTIGDGLLAEFPSVVDAVRCAVEVQRGMMGIDDVPPEKKIEFRVGINVGDIMLDEGDIFGDSVNVAARLESLAEPGGICVSGRVREDVQDKLDIAFEDMGEQQLKNIARQVRVYRVQIGGAVSRSGPALRLPDKPSIAVLPFDNLSSNADEYFVDGVVEEITAALSRVREFFVIARQSAFAYKGRFVDVREVGRELGVSYLVEGTIRRGGDRLRISVQLVDAGARTQLWSGRYEGAITDVFEFQDHIAAQVAGAIHPAIRNAEIEVAKRKPPSNLRAYDLILRAYPNIWSHNKAKNREAISLLREAIANDPSYGRAHALLAWCHSQEVVYFWSSDPEHDRKCAISAVEAASDGIDDDPTALAAAGAALHQCGELDRAGSYIESALALDPNNAWAWARYAWLALYHDDPDRAKERFERALALSPLDPLEFNLRIGIAFVWGFKGEYAIAARMTREVLNKHPGVTWAYRQLASFSALAGDLPAARDAIKMLLTTHPKISIEVMKAIHPMRRVPRVFELLLKGWRLAGLPEK